MNFENIINKIHYLLAWYALELSCSTIRGAKLWIISKYLQKGTNFTFLTKVNSSTAWQKLKLSNASPIILQNDIVGSPKKSYKTRVLMRTKYLLSGAYWLDLDPRIVLCNFWKTSPIEKIDLELFNVRETILDLDFFGTTRSFQWDLSQLMV